MTMKQSQDQAELQFFICSDSRGDGQEAERKLSPLGENESHLLRAVLSGNYDSIKINFRRKQLDSLELIRRHDGHGRIVDILSEADFQDIQVRQHEGRVSHIVSTVKHRYERNPLRRLGEEKKTG